MPVAVSGDVAPETAARAIIGSTDLAVWRGKDDIARVWENRCPHRGMRLSFGFVRDNLLTCLYHGWAYDGGGSCARIPAHSNTKPPKTIKVKKYECAESAGLIWTAPEGIEATAPEFCTEFTGCRTIELNASAAQAVQCLSAKALCLHLPDKDGAALSMDYERGANDEMTFQFAIENHDHVGEVLCAVQPVSVVKSLIHLSAATKSGDTVACKKAVNRLSQRLRLDIEMQTKTLAA